MRYAQVALCGALLLLCAVAYATIFGTIRGLVHDPQHRPVQGAEITLRSTTSEWAQVISSNERGEFQFDAVPLGAYQVSASAPGFAAPPQDVTLISGSVANLHFQFAVAASKTSITVSAEAKEADPESATPTTTISHQQIAATPGAERANSLAMITDFVPGTYMVHDQLHFRGGHQITWLVDGVPVPNTNIASNVGPQFDPKDIATLEVQRGAFSAEYGDRTYGVFNVVTRSGFERNNEGELIASYGSFHQTDDQISFGSHTQRFAYYASLSGNRADLGLETPIEQALHAQAAGLSGFVSLIFNRTPADQLRLVASVRGDHYQVPNDLDQQALGVRDVEDERDDFVNFSWVHTAGAGVTFTLSPFYHFNRAHYIGGFASNAVVPSDAVIPEDNRGSNYIGGLVTLGVVRGKHNVRVGFQGFAQHDNQFFALTGPGASVAPGSALQWGSLTAGFLEDQYKLTRWLTLNGGVRLTRFSGQVTENVADPRIGAAIQVPHLGWVVRGFWGRFYQAPPLLTVSGPLLDIAADQGFGFLPLRGERDEQYDVGISIPVHGWTLEADNFRTSAKNFFDHDVLGNSNIFFPLTIERARIKGTELTIRSPRLGGRAQLHLAWSHQFAQGQGAVTGGLTDFSPPEEGLFFLDHDQRDTVSTGFTVNLPVRAWASGNLSFGSGFLNGDGPDHLPSHTAFDLTLGRSFGERWSVAVSALNLSNSRYMLDNSNTFGGTHFNYPREVFVQVKYRFHY
ncbi:MAG TPA: TonB-dependent receptor [Terriglobales bacterium]|jgi:outer membrane receptor for ferrienterochelin and colicin|nr:TonB-dependent receptor [Terriglobales bacterium]